MVSTLYTTGLWLMGIFALATLISLLFITAPYGRHARAGWGLNMPSRWGWVLMESPSVFWFAFLFWRVPHQSLFAIGLFALWELHYLYRTWVFPFTLRNGQKPMPISIISMGFIFNLFNSTLNGIGLTFVTQPTGFSAWIAGLGCLLFGIGFFIHTRADHLLQNLRRPGETGYKLPYGFLFDWVVSPNYLGEITQWLGFAIAALTPAAWLFAIYTLANLLPRALSHRRWYQAHFTHFPSQRKALIPFVI